MNFVDDAARVAMQLPPKNNEFHVGEDVAATPDEVPNTKCMLADIVSAARTHRSRGGGGAPTWQGLSGWMRQAGDRRK